MASFPPLPTVKLWHLRLTRSPNTHSGCSGLSRGLPSGWLPLSAFKFDYSRSFVFLCTVQMNSFCSNVFCLPCKILIISNIVSPCIQYYLATWNLGSYESSTSNHPVSHLLQAVQDGDGTRGELEPPVFLIPQVWVYLTSFSYITTENTINKATIPL